MCVCRFSGEQCLVCVYVIYTVGAPKCVCVCIVYSVRIQVLPRGSFANYLLTLPTDSRQRRGRGRGEMMETGDEERELFVLLLFWHWCWYWYCHEFQLLAYY